MTLFHPGFCLSWFLLPSIAWLPWVAPPPLLKYSLSHTELLALPSMPACLILLSWFRAPPSPPPSPTSQKSTSDPQFPSNTCITTSCPGRPQGLQSRSTDLSPDFPPPQSNPLLRPHPGNCCLGRYSWNQTTRQVNKWSEADCLWLASWAHRPEALTWFSRRDAEPRVPDALIHLAWKH